MKTHLLTTGILLLLLPATFVAQPAEHKLVQFQMAIIKKGPKWESTTNEERAVILQQHLRYAVSLLSSGREVVAGPFSEATDIFGVFIFRAITSAEAKSWIDDDPAVKAGLMLAEIHPWFSEDVFKKITPPLKMETLYFGFLNKGPNRKEGDDKNPQIQELQKAHLANINRLAETKKLVVAGPFGDDGDYRGIFVFRVGSLKEAQELAATDPMIKIDRLRLDLHEWKVPEGVIP